MKKAMGLMAVSPLSVTMLVSCGGEKDTDTSGTDKGEMAEAGQDELAEQEAEAFGQDEVVEQEVTEPDPDEEEDVEVVVMEPVLITELPELGNVVGTVTTGYNTFSMDGEEYTFMETTCGEIVKGDWEIDDFWNDYTLDSEIEGQMQGELDIKNETYGNFTVFYPGLQFVNTSDDIVELRECVVAGLDFDEDYYIPGLKFAGGIEYGMSYEKVEQLYGSAREVRMGGGVWTDGEVMMYDLVYTWEKDGLIYSLTFGKDDNLENIQIQCAK